MNHALHALVAAVLLVGITGSQALGAPTAASDKAIPAKPALPSLKGLRLEPASLTLGHARDARKVLVLGEKKDGGLVDLTSEAVLKPEGEIVTVDPDHFFTGKSVGKTTVRITAGGLSASLPVEVSSTQALPVGFVRDLEPVLGRANCNQGTCHGSAKGKNGFKLSLRGYDPEYDYQALIQDLAGRRFNRVNVDESLMRRAPPMDRRGGGLAGVRRPTTLGLCPCGPTRAPRGEAHRVDPE